MSDTGQGVFVAADGTYGARCGGCGWAEHGFTDDASAAEVLRLHGDHDDADLWPAAPSTEGADDAPT